MFALSVGYARNLGPQRGIAWSRVRKPLNPQISQITQMKAKTTV